MSKKAYIYTYEMSICDECSYELHNILSQKIPSEYGLPSDTPYSDWPEKARKEYHKRVFQERQLCCIFFVEVERFSLCRTHLQKAGFEFPDD